MTWKFPEVVVSPDWCFIGCFDQELISASQPPGLHRATFAVTDSPPVRCRILSLPRSLPHFDQKLVKRSSATPHSFHNHGFNATSSAPVPGTHVPYSALNTRHAFQSLLLRLSARVASYQSYVCHIQQCVQCPSNRYRYGVERGKLSDAGQTELDWIDAQQRAQAQINTVHCCWQLCPRC